MTTATLSDELGTCRSCAADILWAITDKGKRMPLDPDPVDDGNQYVYRDVDGVRRASAREPMRIPYTRHVSHFATCPMAGRHRGRRG